jgi:hypothetical protein
MFIIQNLSGIGLEFFGFFNEINRQIIFHCDFNKD